MTKNKGFFPLAERIFEQHVRVGQRERTIKSAWGDYSIKIQRWEEIQSKKQKSAALDGSLDSSGWTPWTLQRLLDLAHRLPFNEAAQVAQGFGLPVSAAELERLSQVYSKQLELEVRKQLCQKSNLGLCQKPLQDARIIALELDGVRVLGQAQAGTCEGIEIKTALVYPVGSPSERTRVATVIPAREFTEVLSGLLRQAEVTPQDQLVAISDGAVWIADSLRDLGITQILDVFHAAEYFEKILVASNWSDEERLAERRSLLRGELDIGIWLTTFMLAVNTNTWKPEAIVALQYLKNRTALMCYPSFKARGYPIGSGQIEGMNKHVVGSRMKRSGMQWSRSGASRMAAFRAECLSAHPVTRFQQLRFQAFPPCPPRVTKNRQS